MENLVDTSEVAIITSPVSKPSSSLCQLCRSISLQEMCGPNHDRLQAHQPSYLALKNSASSGCQMCAFIWRALERYRFVDVNGEVSAGRLLLKHVSKKYPGRQISLVAWGRGSHEERRLDRIMITTTGDIPDVDSDEEDVFDPTMHPDYQFALSGSLDLFAYPVNWSSLLIGPGEDDPAAWHGEIRGRPLPRTAGDSDEDFRCAKQWLDDCIKCHEYCKKPKASETPLPTRVLDLGTGDESEEPYLLETGGLHGSYIALSHCWGGHVPLTTTSATFSERKRCISLSSLPRTFRDAVTISRKLGIRYLWIDSLCILQDSKTDWEKESAVMGNVYGQSYLTIAARGAANAETGCFILRKTEPPPCCLEYRVTDDFVKGTMYIRDPAFELERIDQSPLDERGWVLQERILSPRILYYGSQQLYWECTTTTIRQDGKYRDEDFDELRGPDFKQSWDPARASTPKYQLDEDKHLVEMNGISAERLERLRHYYCIAEEYTCRKLTFASDRLPAIAGIAKQFENRTGFTYVAGLWKEDLVAGLLWYRQEMKDAPTSSKLPSWSWARFGGRMRFWSTMKDGYLNVLNTDCELLDLSYETTDNLDNYGEISNAKIQIKGRVANVVLKQSPPERSHSGGSMLYTKRGVFAGKPIFDMKDHSSAQRMGSEFFCLLVHERKHNSAGLLLGRVEEHDTEYRRVGYVMVDWAVLDGKNAFVDIHSQVLTII